MFKLVLAKSEEPEIKLPTSIGSSKSKKVPEKTYTSVWLARPKPLTVWITTNCEKFFKKWDYQSTWPLSWETCNAGQEATVRTGHGTTYWFQIGKGVCQGYILSACLFNLYVEYIMRNVGLEEAQGGIKMARRNIHNLRYTDDTTLKAEGKEKLKSLLMKVKKWKSWVKTQHS